MSEAYHESLDANVQITAEEVIAGHIFDKTSGEVDEETCADLGRTFLRSVLSAFWPDLFEEPPSAHPDINWNNIALQAIRLVGEALATDAFTIHVCDDLCDSMDLEEKQLVELFDRIQEAWDRIKDTAGRR